MGNRASLENQIKINHDYFVKVLHENGFSIRSIGRFSSFRRSERVLREAINKGYIHESLLDEIAVITGISPYELMRFCKITLHKYCFSGSGFYINGIKLKHPESIIVDAKDIYEAQKYFIWKLKKLYNYSNFEYIYIPIENISSF